MLPFYPKLAAASDAPGYTPISSRDEKCEDCRFYRAIASGGGYCEQFSFGATPEGVCDDYSRVERDQVKTSSAIDPALSELKLRKQYASQAARDLTRGKVSKDTALAAIRAAETSRTAKFLKLVDTIDQEYPKKS
jgi:hypothetical protein